MQKVILSLPSSVAADAIDAKKKALADQLGILPEDVILLTGGASVALVDVPDALTKARDKADKEAAKAAEQAEKEKAAAEKAAAEKAAAEAKGAEVKGEAKPAAPTHAAKS